MKKRNLILTQVALSMFISSFSVACTNPEGDNRIASPDTAIATEVVVVADKTETNSRKIKIALLLDTSNSMDGLIEQAKSQLWSIVNELAAAKHEQGRPSLEIALYEYGNDRLSAETGYIRQVLAFSNDLDDLSEKLFELKTNGGDEYCGYVIRTSMNELTWSENPDDLQMIFIAGNEPFNQGSVPFKESCLKAKNKGITVNTIFCGDFQNGISTFWKEGADITGGNYMNIDHNQKTVYIQSPYDPQITQLNINLNQTYISYGSKGSEKKEKQVAEDSKAGSYGEANSVKRAISKSSHFYKNSSWDLVDASDEKDFDLSKVKDEDLPTEMRGKSLAEKEAYIKTKKAERERIKTEIKNLNTQREAYVKEQQKNAAETENQLDDAMIKSIKGQAAKKQLQFEK